jgi:thymidylate synthase
MATVILATSPADAWVNASLHILENGVNVGGLTEELNVITEIHKFNKGEFEEEFDTKFRKIFGDDRIDYAKSVTFLRPEPKKPANKFIEAEQGLDYKFIKDHWYQSYWGRMVSWRGEFNQIEQVIKVLSTGQNVKRCELIIYDPIKDAKNPYSQPCMVAIDLKPRNGKLYLTSMLRSNRISKSGYADYTALTELGEFLAEQSGLELGMVTTIANSCHIGTMNGEKKKTIKLLNELGYEV